MNKIDPAPPHLAPDLIRRFAAIVGDKYAVTDQNDIAPYLTEERMLYHGRSQLVLRPGSTAEVAAICKLANETRTALVPQGGNTGLVGGQTPHNGEVVVSLRRMDRVRDLDPQSNTMTCRIRHGAAERAEIRKRSRSPVSACRSARKEAAPSAATSPPMPAATPPSPTASRAIS